METFEKRVEKLNKWNNALIRVKSPEMNSGETRLYLEISKKFLRLLTKKNLIPYHNRYHKPRLFKKSEINNWLVKICFSPKDEQERQFGEFFVRRGRVKM